MALSPLFAGSVLDFPFGTGRGSRDPIDFGALLPSLSAVAPSAVAHPLDVTETADAFVIDVDTPGMDAGDITITMDEGVLTIAGKKKQETEEKDKAGRVLRRERAFTSFSRSFTLPDTVEEDNISASLDKGVLRVTVPKVAPPPKPEPKRIRVQTVTSGHQEKPAPKVTQGKGSAQ